VTRELVIRAQAGDHAAFTALAAASVSRLHRVARLILRDEERANDAVQEALVAAWLDIRSVRDPDRFDGWVHRLLVRACYREANSHRRRRVFEVQVPLLDAPGSVDTQREVLVRDQLDRGFRRLTPEHRAVLVVHHYLGLRDADAAGALGIAEGTYKSRLNRATTSLRAALEADERTPQAARESVG
jgi:RNA polymerase sigma-70 factor (ECF subfamily)